MHNILSAKTTVTIVIVCDIIHTPVYVKYTIIASILIFIQKLQ